MTNRRETTKQPSAFRKRLNSFVYAFKGIAHAFKTQANFRIHLLISALVIMGGFWYGISTAEWIWIIFAIGMVISAELFNTALEILTDLVSPCKNEKAGKAKDLAAGAVLMAAITAAAIGLVIFLPKIL